MSIPQESMEWIDAVGLVDKDEFTEEYASLIDTICKRYLPRALDILTGRHRNVFIFKNYVIKIPRNINGLADNDWEGSISNAEDGDPEDVQFARTRMVYYKGIPIVFMERADWATRDEIAARLGYEPDWTGSVDCGQVGFNKQGKLVAFDYGLR